ncbi:hypothetical protein [Dactylosporangium sp. CS-033363]|uniref:hypothetical protein n=1 Tax=Dactylosporangium sp. CS-033363 TaxID=3239935 RepID=UPI003D90D9A0
MADGKRIEIDQEGMRDFSAQLQSLVDKDIAPTASLVRHQLTGAAPFGVHTASPAVQAAALRYWHQMEGGIDFLEGLTHLTGSMARAAIDVVTTYHNADVDSLVALRSIENGASKAQSRAEQTVAEADRRAAEHDRLAALSEHRDLHGGKA